MYRNRIRRLAVIGGILLTVQLTAAPAMARTTPGDKTSSLDPIATKPIANNCPLQRIGIQFVKCDNLTGNGVPASPYIPEWG